MLINQYLYLPREKHARHKLQALLILLAILTSSFDEFLNLRIGFSFRFTQICIIAGLGLLLLTKTNLRFKKPLGFDYLMVWFVFIVLFVPNGLLVRNIGYAAWLFFNILTVIFLVQYISSYDRLLWAFRIYIGSFVFVSLFGIVQFILPWVGIYPPFVEQWWVYGLVPRVNGFSYEPSYFATYLLMGWVITSYFRYNCPHRAVKRALVPGLPLIHTIITLGMVLSSSRMGLLMMVGWFLQYPARFLLSIYRLRVKKKLFRINALLAVGGGLVLIVLLSINFSVILRLLGGTGLFGTSAHSTGGRFSIVLQELEVFAQSPLIGYSLGGVAAALAELNGVQGASIAQIKQYEGFSIFVEALVASGMIGFVPFVLYIVSVFYGPLQVATRLQNRELKQLLVSITIALGFELLILQFNQNILRPYVWIHIALLSATYRVAKRTDANYTNHVLNVP